MDADKKTLIKIYITSLFLKDFDECYQKDVNDEIYKKYNFKKIDDPIYNTSILLMEKLAELLKNSYE